MPLYCNCQTSLTRLLTHSNEMLFQLGSMNYSVLFSFFLLIIWGLKLDLSASGAKSINKCVCKSKGCQDRSSHAILACSLHISLWNHQKLLWKHLLCSNDHNNQNHILTCPGPPKANCNCKRSLSLPKNT